MVGNGGTEIRIHSRRAKVAARTFLDALNHADCRQRLSLPIGFMAFLRVYVLLFCTACIAVTEGREWVLCT